MTITYPVNLLPGFPGWTTGFSLHWRQEQSTQASGRVLVKDMGSPLWTLRATTKALSPNQLDHWRARLTALENGLQTFWAYPMSRCFPQAYPNGSWPTGAAFNGTATLASISPNRKAISLSGLPNAFVLSVGDYLSIDGDLHQVMEAATSDGAAPLPPVNTALPVISGTTQVGQSLTVTDGTWSGALRAEGRAATVQFEVRPHLWPAAAVNDPVSVKQPACLMAIVPGSLSSDAQSSGWGSVSFSAMEARL